MATEIPLVRPFYVSVPHAIDLRKESRWLHSEERGIHEYFVFRSHYWVRERTLPGLLQTGQIVTSFQSAPAAGRKIKPSEHAEVEYTSARETIIQSLRESEITTTASVESLLKGKLPGFAEVSSDFKSELEQHVRDSLTTSGRSAETVKVVRKSGIEFECAIPDNSSDTWVVACTYQRRAYDVYLAWMDYLFVRYQKRSFLSLDKFRVKVPMVEGNKHANWVRIHEPVKSLCFWYLVPGGFRCMREQEYTEQVSDPYQVEERELVGTLRYKEKPDIESLYTLSNEPLFPARWSKRKGPGSEQSRLDDAALRA